MFMQVKCRIGADGCAVEQDAFRRTVCMDVFFYFGGGNGEAYPYFCLGGNGRRRCGAAARFLPIGSRLLEKWYRTGIILRISQETNGAGVCYDRNRF